jgi:alpha-N-acetylglucosaminidase
MFFASLDAELRTGIQGNPIDWFALGDAWNHSTQLYSDRPHGDAYIVAKRIAKSLTIEVRRP